MTYRVFTLTAGGQWQPHGLRRAGSQRSAALALVRDELSVEVGESVTVRTIGAGHVPHQWRITRETSGYTIRPI